MTRDNYKQFVRYLVSINKDIINKTALSNCHCIGLNSFIINEKPKIRLFVAEPNCELYKDFDLYNPLLPIHPHKYNDLFITLEGNIIQYIYSKNKEGYLINKYNYSRISDGKLTPELIGKENIIIKTIWSNMEYLPSNELHTVKLESTKGKCSWIVIETFEDSNFKQVAYHKDLKERNELYKPIENGFDYLINYLK